MSLVLMVVSIVIIGPFPPIVVMAVLMLVGVVLTRWKTRIGAIVIAVPSIALLVLFAGDSALFVATHPIAFIDIFGGLIMTLAVALLVNLVAVVATLAEGRLSSLRSQRASAIVAALGVLVVVVVAALGGRRGLASPMPQLLPVTPGSR